MTSAANAKGPGNGASKANYAKRIRGRYLYVGFMCQQTVEKALKAMIAKQGIFPPKIHDLIRLAELANLGSLLSAEQNQLLDELYPLHKERLHRMLNDHACGKYIMQTEVMLKWIKEKL